VFCREDGTPLDRWHVRKEFHKITRAARPGGEWTPRELRHSFVSILSAHDVRLESISDLVGHTSTSVTETVYRHEIRPALTERHRREPHPEGERHRAGLAPAPGKPLAPQLAPEN
jgi:integrase